MPKKLYLSQRIVTELTVWQIRLHTPSGICLLRHHPYVSTAESELGSIKNYYYIDLPAPVATTFSEEGWATTCLPFNAEVPEGINVWNATGIANGELVMENISAAALSSSGGRPAVIPAGTPVLLQSNSLTNYEWFSRVAAANIQAAGSIFSGTTEPKSVDGGSVLTLAAWMLAAATRESHS